MECLVDTETHFACIFVIQLFDCNLVLFCLLRLCDYINFLLFDDYLFFTYIKWKRKIFLVLVTTCCLTVSVLYIIIWKRKSFFVLCYNTLFEYRFIGFWNTWFFSSHVQAFLPFWFLYSSLCLSLLLPRLSLSVHLCVQSGLYAGGRCCGVRARSTHNRFVFCLNRIYNTQEIIYCRIVFVTVMKYKQTSNESWFLENDCMFLLLFFKMREETLQSFFRSFNSESQTVPVRLEPTQQIDNCFLITDLN